MYCQILAPLRSWVWHNCLLHAFLTFPQLNLFLSPSVFSRSTEKAIIHSEWLETHRSIKHDYFLCLLTVGNHQPIGTVRPWHNTIVYHLPHLLTCISVVLHSCCICSEFGLHTKFCRVYLQPPGIKTGAGRGAVLCSRSHHY